MTAHKRHREEVRIRLGLKTGPSAKKCLICNPPPPEAEPEAPAEAAAQPAEETEKEVPNE